MADEQRRTDVLTGGAAAALADLVDAGGPDWDSDVLLPPLWHWVYLVDSPRRRDLGPEGHSIEGVPSPPGREWARLFATVDIVVEQGGAVAITEQQDFVYRPLEFRNRSRGDTAEASTGPLEPLAAAVQWEFDVDPIVLFRFSALTFNSHRIHYDHPYATQIEGYPDLVVQGWTSRSRTQVVGSLHAQRPSSAARQDANHFQLH